MAGVTPALPPPEPGVGTLVMTVLRGEDLVQMDPVPAQGRGRLYG